MARNEDRDYGLPARRQETGLTSYGEPDYGFSSPFALFHRMQEDMDRMWSQFFGGPGFGGSSTRFPSVDMHESENEVVVRADLPGIEAEDLEVFCADDRLIIRGETRRQEETKEQGRLRSERRYGRFERVLPLPGDVKADQIQASFRNGVLELRIPKSEEARQRMRRIPIHGVQPMAGAKGGEVAAAATPSANTQQGDAGGSSKPGNAPG